MDLINLAEDGTSVGRLSGATKRMFPYNVGIL